MRERRVLFEGATYHVTSRTNGKIDAFSGNVGQKILLQVIKNAKEKYGFMLHNFCIMPNHFHLLITPKRETNLSKIMQWIKTKSAKCWNFSHNTENHLWGDRFFSRPIIDDEEFFAVYNYIDLNPVKAGLVENPIDWKVCGAYYLANDCEL